MSRVTIDRNYLTLDLNPLATIGAISDGSLLRVSGRYLYTSKASRDVATPNGRNTRPFGRKSSRLGKVMPTRKLKAHELRLPKAIPAGRGPTSKSSGKYFFKDHFLHFLTSYA